MTGKTHMLGGAAAFAAALALTGQTNPGIMTAVAGGATIVGALFPDIDLQTSKAGQAAKPMSFVISHLFGHRTLFHSPLLYILLYLLGTKLGTTWLPLVQAFMLGVSSHIVLDMLNKKGIPLLYPCTKHFYVATVKSGGNAEYIVDGMLVMVLAASVVKWVQVLI